jgi:hypothetical protein
MSSEADAAAGYLQTLSAELTRVGIQGALRRRIVTELADHLESDPDADLGSPHTLARQFADELGTVRARTVAFRAFAALALAGTLFALTVAATAIRGGVGRSNVSTPVRLLLLCCLLAGQVSFVAGGLGFLRAYRLRGQRVVSRGEAVVLRRRASVGLATGALTMIALPVMVLAAPPLLTSSWRMVAWVAAGVGLVAIAAASPAVIAAARVRPSADGGAGDLFSDLGPSVPESLRVAPWRFAFVVAFVLAVVVAIAGASAMDPYDGALRGLLEGAALLVGFGLLGPYLGLRSRESGH